MGINVRFGASNVVQDSPSRDQNKFVVRFPDGMRDLIAEAAKTNNRSMNAEIITRLASTFEVENDTIDEKSILKGIRDEYDQKLKELVRQLRLFNLTSDKSSYGKNIEEISSIDKQLRSISASYDSTIVYLYLDTNGMPICWGEIYEYIGAVVRSGLKNAVLNVKVITPELVASEKREDQTHALYERFREFFRSRRQKT